MAKIAINGFGRIGRLFFRQVFGVEKNLEIVAINDLGDAKNLAYLLKYDTVYRTYSKDVQVSEDHLVVGGKKIRFLQEKDPLRLPWKDLGINIAVESTGVFDSFAKAKVHLEAGAKRVVITAPAHDADGPNGKTILMGINEEEMKGVKCTAHGSCTTNASSPAIQVMAENPGIVKAVLSTVHANTSLQGIVDVPTKRKNFRYGRSGAYNIVPFPTGAAIAVTRAIKELEGKFDGLAFRVPVPTGSVADITFLAKRKTSVEEINKIFRDAANSTRWRGILKVVEEPIVSSDIIGEPYGAIVDLGFTRVIDGDLVKVLSWYDNEWGYTATLVRHVKKAASLL